MGATTSISIGMGVTTSINIGGINLNSHLYVSAAAEFMNNITHTIYIISMVILMLANYITQY